MEVQSCVEACSGEGGRGAWGHTVGGDADDDVRLAERELLPERAGWHAGWHAGCLGADELRQQRQRHHSDLRIDEMGQEPHHVQLARAVASRSRT